jgi:hypothetical protein
MKSNPFVIGSFLSLAIHALIFSLFIIVVPVAPEIPKPFFIFLGSVFQNDEGGEANLNQKALTSLPFKIYRYQEGDYSFWGEKPQTTEVTKAPDKKTLKTTFEPKPETPLSTSDPDLSPDQLPYQPLKFNLR